MIILTLQIAIGLWLGVLLVTVTFAAGFKLAKKIEKNKRHGYPYSWSNASRSYVRRAMVAISGRRDWRRKEVMTGLHIIIDDPPPLGWRRGHVSVNMENDKRMPVEAWLRSLFALHQQKNGDWCLTHAPTGRLIYRFANQRVAATAADAIEPLTDWTQITSQVPIESALHPLKDAIEAIITPLIAPGRDGWVRGDGARPTLQ